MLCLVNLIVEARLQVLYVKLVLNGIRYPSHQTQEMTTRVLVNGIAELLTTVSHLCRHAAYLLLIVCGQTHILLPLATIQVDDGLEVLQLPLRPFVQRAVHHREIIACVDEEHSVLVFQTLGLV